jgi:Amt family ammonium transporter
MNNRFTRILIGVGPALGLTLLASTGMAQDAAAPAASAITLDSGDTAWMLTSTALVLMMTIPGLALFYGGMVRKKNLLGTLMQSFAITCAVTLTWVILTYGMAFTGDSPYLPGFDRILLHGMGLNDLALPNKVPESVFMMFQMTFAIITPALIAGAFADRMKFSAMLVFMVLWSIFDYAPIAHWVWNTDAAGNAVGFLGKLGVLDFAGGTVVHINAGVAGLVGALVIGNRLGYKKESFAPHSVTFSMIGASLLWVGWFGFNVGSNLEANGLATLVFVNTLLATAAATLSWLSAEWLIRGKPSMLGGASGAVAGLVAITPACGWAGPMGSIALGLGVGALCFWSVSSLKNMLGYDDSLDAFGVHAVGGIFGALGTAIVANPDLGGTGVWDYVANAVAPYDTTTQLISQVWGVGITIVWTSVVAFVAYKIVDITIGLRVTEAVEREGLDVAEHGETAYHQ